MTSRSQLELAPVRIAWSFSALVPSEAQTWRAFLVSSLLPAAAAARLCGNGNDIICKSFFSGDGAKWEMGLRVNEPSYFSLDHASAAEDILWEWWDFYELGGNPRNNNTVVLNRYGIFTEPMQTNYNALSLFGGMFQTDHPFPPRRKTH